MLLAAFATALLTACLSVQVGSWVGDSPKPKTQDDLYEMYGLPDAIRTTRADEGAHWLRYDSNEAKGMKFGVGPFGASFYVARQHAAGDTVWFRVAEDGRITEVEAGQNTDSLENRLWPFSD